MKTLFGAKFVKILILKIPKFSQRRIS